jgi:ABC-type nitrate/sulfonate/bicarbonate transport system permease component
MSTPTIDASQRTPTKSGPATLRWWLDRPNVIRTLSVAVFLVVWEYFGLKVDPLFLAAPSAIVEAGLALVRNGELFHAFLATFYPFAVGMAITVVGGIVIGVAMAQWPLLEYILDPFINALYAIPRIALVPLIMLWAGLAIGGKVVILVSIAIFPVIINTFSGIRDVRGSMLEVGRAYGATKSQIFFKIVLPATIPFVMTGIRLAVGMGIIGIIVAGFFTAQTGLGGMIVMYANVFATAKLFVPIIVIGLMGVVLTEFVQAIERRLSRWRQLERERG